MTILHSCKINQYAEAADLMKTFIRSMEQEARGFMRSPRIQPYVETDEGVFYPCIARSFALNVDVHGYGNDGNTLIIPNASAVVAKHWLFVHGTQVFHSNKDQRQFGYDTDMHYLSSHDSCWNSYLDQGFMDALTNVTQNMLPDGYFEMENHSPNPFHFFPYINEGLSTGFADFLAVRTKMEKVQLGKRIWDSIPVIQSIKPTTLTGMDDKGRLTWNIK